MGNDPCYSKTRCFDPFPFPELDPKLRGEIARIAEVIDAYRKTRQAEHPDLMLTQMYNVLERLRTVQTPTPGPSPQGGGSEAG